MQLKQFFEYLDSLVHCKTDEEFDLDTGELSHSGHDLLQCTR